MANLRISELDFEFIKSNLKTFLQSQEEFTDYDFEGSGLSVLIDLLAYNTHYNSYLANMLVNEMFLDSAVKRSSVVSLAKHLGYTPMSVRGSIANIGLTVRNPTNLPTNLVLPKYTPFTSTINGTAYTFYNITELSTTTPDGSNYYFPSIDIIQGTLLEDTYVSVEPGPMEKFEIKDENVDISTIEVVVQKSATDTTIETFTQIDDLLTTNGSSKIYFVEETPQGRYQIFFGDGTIGKKLDVGNIITVRYLSSVGEETNVSDSFPQSFSVTSVGGSSDTLISVTVRSHAGKQKESISSIKFNAPLFNEARNRAVSANDYKALILSNYSDAESISVWGGEDNDPPVYGKVFISLKPFENFFISQSTKETIISDVLQNKKVLGIQPEFVDPEYINVTLSIDLVFDSNSTTKSPSELQSIVEGTVRVYFNSELNSFNTKFNKAKLTKLILESDPSIVSVIILIGIQKRNTLVLNSVNNFIDQNTIKFFNRLVPGSVFSSRFFYPVSNTTTLCNIIDIPSTMPPDPNGTGSLRIINSTSRVTVNSNIGTVNYGSGEVFIENFIPTALPNNVNDFRVNALVQEIGHNLTSARNQILVLDDSTTNAAIGRTAGLKINITPNLL